MTDESLSFIPVNDKLSRTAWVQESDYLARYKMSIDDPDAFWAEQAKILTWSRFPSTIKRVSFEDPVNIRWYEDGVLNVSYNCLDRHLATKGNETAIIWEGDTPGDSRHISYNELHGEVCRMANVLKNLGVCRGDRVTIYLPMVPEAAVAMLACARIGAIHSVVFGGFSAQALRDRLQDCDSTLLITADEGHRGGKKVPLKANADEALESCPKVKNVLVVQRTGSLIAWKNGRDHWYHDMVRDVSDVCEPVPMNGEEPLFILYTSGSTGKPKGVLHSTAGYLVYATSTFKDVFDYHDGDVFWSTADVGWVTGHSYVVYGPLAAGATTLMFEGVPNYPDPGRFWQVVEKYKVNIFYTAPTAIRALMREGTEWVKKYDRSSIRILGSVGEPINPEAWLWYWREVGEKRCPIVDTWWQTETGGVLITALPGAMGLKPGSAAQPYFGVQPVIVDHHGHPLDGPCEGNLCLAGSWPGQARTVFRDHARFVQTYFSTYKGMYFTGDGCRRDEDGYYWITGRVDDVINVSGHRIGTAEVESALVSHPSVAESAVVGCPHEIKGQGIYAYVTLKAGIDATDELKKELVMWVRKEIGPIAAPDLLQWAPALPKTRSGKIMRRILRKIAAGEHDALGDTSTLADPAVVDDLIARKVG